jgi:hypothetical protein
MSEPVRARRLNPDEGHYLLCLVRRGRHETIRVRRALIIMASASGTTVAAIARLVAADEDTVRDVIHAFNTEGLSCLGPHWAGGRPLPCRPAIPRPDHTLAGGSGRFQKSATGTSRSSLQR